MRKYTPYMILTICLFLLGSYGCAKKSDNKEVVIQINDHKITDSEFNELYNEVLAGAKDTKANRQAFLDNIINRKLLLQEAEREGLDKQKDFLRTVERFWEQSLLKIVVDNKVKDISKNIKVTDKEVRGYYDKWASQNPKNTKSFDDMKNIIRTQLLRAKQSIAFNNWVQDLKDRSSIKIDRKALGLD